MFSKQFIDEAKALYPSWDDLHAAIANESGIVGRYLCDSAPDGISYQDVLSATSLDALKKKAVIIKRKNDLYMAYCNGSCYQSEAERREHLGCPRLYAQSTDDDAALYAFKCYGVFHIPSCPKFKTGECWKRFDDLGLKMQEA